jgi:serine/threonine protein kinase
MSDPAPAGPSADHNLLFGVLALQADLIDSGQFAEACTAWSSRKGTPLADFLVERGWLDADARADVERMLERKTKKYGGDARAGLAEVATDRVRQSLAGLTDPVVLQSLGTSTPALQGHALHSTSEHVPEARERYTLSRLHATGGIGRVWLAHDQSLGRDVALKELLPERAARPALWARFLQEARVTGQLEHPGVVPIYEVGHRSDDQAPYYTMRFVRGRTLAEAASAYHRRRLQAEAAPLELRGLLTAFVGVCNAVAYAHSRGVIHRDLKPQNVVLGDYGEAIVLDWGLARLIDPPAGSDEAFAPPVDAGTEVVATMQGQALGTPAYMAPEQAEGRIDLLGPRTDVYGLGAVLYEVLTGKPPFSGDDTAEVLRRVVHEEPRRPRSLADRTPAALEAVCLKALEKRPAARYESAKALAADIERWMADEPVSAWPEPLRVRTGRWVRKHRTGVATTLAALVVAVVGLLAVAALQAEAGRRLDAKNCELEVTNLQVAEARDSAERRADLALDAVENFRTTVVNNLDVQNRPENSALRKALLQAPLAFYKRLRDDLRASEESGPKSRAKLADAYLKLAELDGEIGSQAEALKAYDEAVALLETPPAGALDTLRSGFRDRLAEALGERGKLQGDSNAMTDAALKSLQRARELREARLQEDPGDIASRVSLAGVLGDVARIQTKRGETDAALETLRASQRLLEEARRLDPSHVGVALHLVGTRQQASEILLRQKARLPEALAAAESAVEVIEPLARARPDDVECQLMLSSSFEKLAAVHQERGEFAEAVKDYGNQLTAVDSLVRVRPGVNRYQLNRVKALRQVAACQTRLGRNDESLKTFLKAVDLSKALAHDNPTNTEFQKELSSTYNNMALPLFALGRMPDALKSIESAADALEEVARTDPKDVDVLRSIAGARYNCGYLNYELGRVQAALASYNQSLLLRERLAREHPDNPRFAFEAASTRGNLGSIQFDLRQLPDSRASFQRQGEILEKLVAVHPESAEYRSYLARQRQSLGSVILEQGDMKETRRLLRASLELCEPLAREHPEVVQYQTDVARSLGTLGDALRKDGKTDEAAAAYQKAISIREEVFHDSPDDPENRYELAELHLLSGIAEQDRGRASDAVRDYRLAAELCDRDAAPTPNLYYQQARVHARLGAIADKNGSGLTVAEGRAEIGNAVEALRRAVKAGYHSADRMRENEDLAPLRGRDDFRELLRQVETSEKSK